MNTFLAGEKVVLRSLELEDLDTFWTWFADREVVRYSMGTWLFPWSKKETEQWLQQTLQEKTTLTLGVVRKGGSQLIGYAGIASISRINHSGE